MLPLDICVEQIANIQVLGNPLHVGVEVVAYFGNFGCLQRPKSAGDRERKMIKLNEIILYYDRLLHGLLFLKSILLFLGALCSYLHYIHIDFM
jgi:hypothetical protein